MIKNKIILTLVLFIIFVISTLSISSITSITAFDKEIELIIQNSLNFIPTEFPVFADKTGYIIMLFTALICVSLYFIKKRKWIQIPIFLSIPVIAYCINFIIKHIIQRSRPPIELQIANIHPHSYSYVSTHTLITFCIYGMIIYYFIKYCSNKSIKTLFISISVLWILLTGLSRIWIGVHYPTDIIGAFLLGSIIIIFYIELTKILERK